MSAPTKTVQGTFKPLQLTREQFVARWTEHFAETYKLADDKATLDRLHDMGETIANLAGAEWDRLK